MNKEIKEALERLETQTKDIESIKTFLSVTKIGNEEALKILKQQPPTSEFTKKNRRYFTLLPEEECDSLVQKAVRHCSLVIQEACDRLDRAEASKAELLKALKRYGHHDSPCAGILDLNEDAECTCGFEAAKAKKENGGGECLKNSES